VKLIEADSGWSKRSRVYLGRKRAARCTFTCARLEELPSLPPCTADLVWVQWTLQYLTDRDVVKCLQALAAGLSDQGLLIIKENRPYGSQRPDRFPARIQPIVVSAERERRRECARTPQDAHVLRKAHTGSSWKFQRGNKDVSISHVLTITTGYPLA